MEKIDFSDFGEFLPNEKSSVNTDYFRFLLQSVETVINGMKTAGADCTEYERKRDKLLKFLEDFDEDQRD